MCPASSMAPVSLGQTRSAVEDSSTTEVSRLDVSFGGVAYTMAASRSFEDLKPTWLQLETELHLSPFQSFDWCQQFWLSGLAGHDAKLHLITATRISGETDLLMPLFTRRRGGVLVAEMLNDSNAAHRAPILRFPLAEILSAPNERKR